MATSIGPKRPASTKRHYCRLARVEHCALPLRNAYGTRVAHKPRCCLHPAKRRIGRRRSDEPGGASRSLGAQRPNELLTARLADWQSGAVKERKPAH